MLIVFEVPENRIDAINEIKSVCDISSIWNKENPDGKKVIGISAAVTPAAWDLVKAYTSDNEIRVEEMTDTRTIMISSEIPKRAMQKYEQLRAEWEQANAGQAPDSER